MTWEEWFDFFNGLFGCRSWKEVKVHSWINNVFVPGGLTPEELRDAALVLARGESPSFPQEIMQALLDEVRQARVTDLMVREDQERRGGGEVGSPLCRLCGGTGLCSVPHDPQPEAAVKGNFLWTHWVSCKCSAGLRMAQVCRNHKDEALMPLAQYERGNPQWQEQVRWWAHHDKCEGNVGAKAEEWQRLVDKLLKTARGKKVNRKGG